MARSKTDRPIPSGVPKGFRGERQIDGTQTTHFTAPTKGLGLQDRMPAPDRGSDSGIERALGSLADREHSR